MGRKKNVVPETDKNKVVLYLRYSSAKQNEQSIEGQARVCRDFCASHGLSIIGIYVDREKSASKDTDKRYEFQRMIKDAEKHQFGGIVVYKLDRFARSRYDSAIYKNKLKQNGVRVISATEAIGISDESIILESVLEAWAEYYSVDLAQKVNRGMYESAKKGGFVGGTIPLGYKSVNKHLVIDEVRAEWVKEAFALYADGHTMEEIANLFNSRGYRTMRGEKFSRNSFHTMLRNERYLGYYIFKDIKIEGGIPAIIDRETFDKVREVMRRNGVSPGSKKAKINYLLSGKIFCGHCGSAMIGDSGTSHSGDTYYYYSCGNHKNHKSCDKKPNKKELIERAVVEDTMKIITSDLIEEIADTAIRAAEKENENNTVIPALQAEISDVAKKIQNLMSVIESGTVSETISERIKELEKEKKSLEMQLKKESFGIRVLDRKQIIYFLNKFTDGEVDDETFQRHVINLLVNSVTVYDDPDGFRLKIVYNLSGIGERIVRESDLASSQLHDVRISDAIVHQSPHIRTFSRVFFVERKPFLVIERRHTL